jgi:hypothetical protein
MVESEEMKAAPRGLPMVATWARCGAATVVLGFALLVVARAYLTLSHADRSLASLVPILVAGWSILAGLLWAMLRTEEARLARELRIARSGTSVLRAIAMQRGQRGPALARLLSTRLGAAAILVADGSRTDALDALSGGSPLMMGGRLEKLRSIVEADLERATGGPGLDACSRRLQAMAVIGNREADLYRTHVLVKALLERGDAETSLELAQKLETSPDDEERVYVAWLRAWFDFDAEASRGARSWRTLAEGELRMAMLLARAHGADKLVEKLEARVAGIARPLDGE